MAVKKRKKNAQELYKIAEKKCKNKMSQQKNKTWLELIAFFDGDLMIDIWQWKLAALSGIVFRSIYAILLFLSLSNYLFRLNVIRSRGGVARASLVKVKCKPELAAALAIGWRTID